MTPTGYTAEAALAAARGATLNGQPGASGLVRIELANLQRDLFAARTAVNYMAAVLRQGEDPSPTTRAATNEQIAHCAKAVDSLDDVVAIIHRALR